MSEIKMLTPKEIITTISNNKTGEIYKDEEALKAKGYKAEEMAQDVKVIMPPLDLFAKTK